MYAYSMINLSRVRGIRKEKGLTQEQVATELGMSRPSYVKFEDGDKELTVSQVTTLSSLLGVSLLSDSPEETQAKIDKFRSMILAFIAFGGANDGLVTKTKLAKMLYFADAQTFKLRGQTISGLIYRKLPQGPVPYEFFQSIDEMADNKIIDIKFSGLAQMIGTVEPVNIEELNLEGNELSLIEDIAKKWKDKRTDAIVNYSHQHTTWLNAEEYEPINMALLRSFDKPIY